MVLNLEKECLFVQLKWYLITQVIKIQGMWGRYDEISIKRTLNRDSESNYYINNQNVRKRDVIDIFYGTGLGPRGYSIIEQGTIGRLVDARPEELKVYIEEAAGVSKYKERKKKQKHV